MKIAHIICTFPPYKGGMGNSVACFAKESLKLQHQITILTPNYGQPVEHTEDWQGIKVVRLKPALTIGNAAILPGIFKYLPEFDVVHLHYPFYGTAELVALAKIKMWRKLKLVVHYHMDTKAGGIKGLIFMVYNFFWLPIILRLADEITCASLDYIKHSNAGGYFLKHRKKFTQVSFGVDLDRFQPAVNQNSKTLKNILFVGGLDQAHYFKGVDNLIKAFALVNSEAPESRLTIVGRGDMEASYQALAKMQKIDDKVNFINNASDEALVKIYQSGDLLVLPSVNQSEAFGLVLLEAMACGLPVVASNLPGVRSVFKNNKHGFNVRPGDVDDLAQKITWLLNNEEMRKRFGLAARAWAEKRYNWRLAGEKLNEVYYRVRYTPGLKNNKHNGI